MLNNLKESAILIALATAILYSLSLAEINGYHSSLGIEGGFITKSSYQILYNTVYIILLPGFIPAAIAFIAFMFGSLLFDVIQATKNKNRKIKRWLAKWKWEHAYLWYDYPGRTDAQPIKFKKAIDKTLLIMLVIFCMLVLLLYSEYKGKDRGKEVLERIMFNDVAQTELVCIDGYDAAKIFVVSCGENNCAGIDVDNMKVVYFENKFSKPAISDLVGG